MSARGVAWLWGALALGVAVTLWWLSSQPGGTLRAPTGNDKLLHAAAWTTLSGCVALALYPRFGPRLAWALAVGLSVAYGVVDEVHQSFTPGRDVSGLDVVADAVGALLGSTVAVAVVAGRLVYRRRDEHHP
jgi:VanZ family protein